MRSWLHHAEFGRNIHQGVCNLYAVRILKINVTWSHNAQSGNVPINVETKVMLTLKYGKDTEHGQMKHQSPESPAAELDTEIASERDEGYKLRWPSGPLILDEHVTFASCRRKFVCLSSVCHV